MPDYPKPDRDKMQDIVNMARDVTRNHPNVPIIGYNLLFTIAWLADELDEVTSQLGQAQLEIGALDSNIASSRDAMWDSQYGGTVEDDPNA